MKPLVRLLALLILLLAGSGAEAATITITVGDNFYSPQLITVHPGDVVKWQYQGGTNSHPTASDNAAWTTFTINSANPTNSITFNTVGSFPYHCNFHGGVGVGMYGIITVAAALPVTAAQASSSIFQAYPNPAHEAVTLKLDRAQLHDATTAQLVDMMGRVVRSLDISPAAADHELTVSVAGLPTGMYIYRLLAGRELLATQRLTLVR